MYLQMLIYLRTLTKKNMKFWTHIDIWYNQQFEISVFESKQNKKNQKHILANVDKIRKNEKFWIHIDIQYNQQFEISVFNSKQNKKSQKHVFANVDKKKIWNSEHTSTFDTINNLKFLYLNQNKIKKIENMYLRREMGRKLFNRIMIEMRILFILFKWNRRNFYFDIISKKTFIISKFFIRMKKFLDIISFFRIDLIIFSKFQFWNFNFFNHFLIHTNLDLEIFSSIRFFDEISFTKMRRIYFIIFQRIICILIFNLSI